MNSDRISLLRYAIWWPIAAEGMYEASRSFRERYIGPGPLCGFPGDIVACAQQAEWAADAARKGRESLFALLGYGKYGEDYIHG